MEEKVTISDIKVGDLVLNKRTNDRSVLLRISKIVQDNRADFFETFSDQHHTGYFEKSLISGFQKISEGLWFYDFWSYWREKYKVDS